MPFSENSPSSQPRDAIGQFAQKTGSSAEVTLASEDPALTAALARYGIGTADVPLDHEGKGIEERWAEYFDVLNDPRLMTVEEHLNTELGNLDFGRLRSGPWLAWRDDDADLEDWETVRPGDDWAGREPVAMVHTRNGGGNRDCYCEEDDEFEHEPGCLQVVNETLQSHPAFLTDQDNTWDRTYANFAFRVDRKKAKAAMATAAPSRDQESARRMKASIEAGRLTPWTVFPSNPATVARIEELTGSKERIETGAVNKLPSGASVSGYIGQEHVDDLEDKLRVLQGGEPRPEQKSTRRLWVYDRYSKPETEYQNLMKTERAAEAAEAARAAIADPETSDAIRLALTTGLEASFGLNYEEKKLNERRAAHAKLVTALSADLAAATAAIQRKNVRAYIDKEIADLRAEVTWPGTERAPQPVQ